jgi:hypothetical protein
MGKPTASKLGNDHGIPDNLDTNRQHMNRIPQFNLKRSMFSAAIAACAFATLCVSSKAADLGPDYRSGVRHARTTLYYSNWRDRCAYAGFYCLYAWDGYIYSYPWDDRPSAYAYRRHHRRHIY